MPRHVVACRATTLIKGLAPAPSKKRAPLPYSSAATHTGQAWWLNTMTCIVVSNKVGDVVLVIRLERPGSWTESDCKSETLASGRPSSDGNHAIPLLFPFCILGLLRRYSGALLFAVSTAGTAISQSSSLEALTHHTLVISNMNNADAPDLPRLPASSPG